MICGDLNKDASFVLPSFYAEHGIISTVDVVINKKDGTPYGVLEIDSPEQHDYGKHDIAFLTGFANILAEAVATSKRNLTLQGAFDRMQDMVGDRDRLLAAQNTLLDEKTRLLDDKTVPGARAATSVRNNLQLVHGMLDKQLQNTDDGAGKDGSARSLGGSQSLAQVYDQLLGTGMTRTIDFGAYLSSLCSSFAALEYAEHPKIVQTRHCERVILDLDTVTAMGLVVSELIANSYAHAFPDGSGSIDVALSVNPQGDEATIVF